MSDDETERGLAIDRKNSGTPSVHEQDVGFEWNDQHEELLRKWKDRSENYSQLHDWAGKRFSKFHTWLGLPTKLLLSLIATIEFSQLSNVDSSGWSFYFNGFVAILSLGFETAQDYLGWSSRATKHFSAAAIYDKLALNIEMELCHPRTKRTNVRAFMRHAKTILQDLKETAPDIPFHMLNQYVEKIPVERTTTSRHVRIPLQISPAVPSVAPPAAEHQNLAPPVNPETDLQDEFALEMQRRIQEKKDKLEQFQIQRFNESEKIND